MKIDPTFVIGDQVKDLVDGFQGVVIGVTRFLTGCVHFHVQPPVNKTGEPHPAASIAVQRLAINDSLPKVEIPDGLTTYETIFELGQKVRNKTCPDQTGVVIGAVFHEVGVPSLLVQLPVGEDIGKPARVTAIAEYALELTGEANVDLSTVVNSNKPPSPGEDSHISQIPTID